ncbi:SANT and BTB domain regulator of class switch recombination isoform X7 [Hydra vulgaris]|uniref:SANT and BTB domain regulator of class switch recombination isoform X7 n=1 Tax=Hydra vulgaris TaxID=6087 RepID=A0ABM4CX34_HYDVU
MFWISSFKRNCCYFDLAMRDFKCSGYLLLKEMPYFRDYLSLSHQWSHHQWSNIDITVHCDVNIFQWLINYIKKKSGEELKLDVNNIVPLLLSSEFLRMNSLVKKCINFCCSHLNDVIAASNNMHGISDKIVYRIASRFDQRQIYQLQDNDDKFKSRLFRVKLDEIFKPDYSTELSPNNASTLFRCLVCGKYLLAYICNRISCSIDRMTIDSYGNIRWCHVRDSLWSSADYLLMLKEELKSWTLVYWRIWSLINYMQCNVCDTIFPVADFKTCVYHPGAIIRASSNGKTDSTFQCCGQPEKKFEFLELYDGCQIKDHDIVFESSYEKNAILCTKQLYNELKNVIDVICFQKNATTATSNSFSQCSVTKSRFFSQDRIIECRSENSNECSSLCRSSQKTSKQLEQFPILKKDQRFVKPLSNLTWNNYLPLRLNQDIQREQDDKRMNDILKRLNLHLEYHNDEGGIFSTLENRLKTLKIKTR